MVMRVTEGQISRMIYLGTQNNLGNMARLQEMTSTGKRINSYADDPRGVGLVRHYESLMEQNAQYQRNINRGRTMVEATDTALQELLELLRDAGQVARREVSGASSTWQTRNVGAAEIDGMINQAMTLLNQTVEGNSLFGGFRTDLPPFIKSATGEVLYQGDVNEMLARIGPNTEMVLNVPGSELLGSDLSILGGFGDVAARLATTTSLSDLSLGEGWEMGTVFFTGSSGVEQSVDLSGAGTIGDVMDLLTTAGLTVGFTSDGRGLEITDPGGGPLTIRDEVGENAATSLGIAGSSETGLITGTDIRTAPVWGSALVDIESLAASLPLGSIHLEMNGTDLTIDLSGAATLDDIRTTFEAAVTGAGLPPLSMELDGRAINIVSDTGETYTITNEPGDSTAVTLGIDGTGQPSRLFHTLESLAASLRADDVDGIRTAIGELEAIERHIYKLEIDVGGRESLLEWSEGLISQRDYHLQSNLSQIRDADIIEVASSLTQAETAYQASLMVSSKMLSMNLFDFI